MKKVIFAIAIVTTAFAACNNASTPETPAVDSAKIADSLKQVAAADSAKAAAAIADTAKKAAADTAKKVVADSTKK